MLKVDNLDTFYGELQVIRNISLTVETGDLVVMLGPNGHGKSTLLKAICGLIKPKAGKVEFGGEDVHSFSIEKIVEKGLVYIPEDRRLFPQMTIKENLLLGAYNPIARKEREKNLEFVYQLFPKLKKMYARTVATLSGGEARMVAVGRGLMASAKFLAIDEPSLGLAPNLRTELFDKIHQINKAGITVLLVEQCVTEVLDYADRVYVIEDGRIVYNGNKEEVLNDKDVKKALLGIE
ncbi:MAG: ABC transporter ATP-binding protein [Desulfobacterales bacterium]|nr:ABC transporter ATP-binding protein [Desulfobacterales bacterium]